MIDDPYSSGAKHYDAAYGVKDNLTNRDFYLDLANTLGCGTGRITLPLWSQGWTCPRIGLRHRTNYLATGETRY